MNLKTTNFIRKFATFFLALCYAVGWGQASATLPLTRTAWGTTVPTGWTDNGTNRTSSYACSGNDGGSMQAANKFYKVKFNASPDKLSFSLKGSNPTTGDFRVQESSDGTNWTDVKKYTSITGTTCSSENNLQLSASSRYVQFIYISKTTGNVDIDDVSITKLASTIPTLTVDKTTLTGLNYTLNNGPSAAQSVTVTGTNTTQSISVAAPANFEVSTTADGNYAGSATLGANGGSVYVRLKAGLAIGKYNGNLTVSSQDAANVETALSGEVSASATGTACLSEDFTGLSGNNTATAGSNTAWTGNTNFPTVSAAYQAGSAVKLGSGSATGSITSKAFTQAGSVTVNFDVKGWTAVEGDIKITISGQTPQTQTVTYTAVMKDSFESKSVKFDNVAAGQTLTIGTTANRAFIDNVSVTCSAGTTSTYIEANPTSVTGLDYTLGNGPSAAKSVAVTGTNTSDVITATAPANFEVSATAEGTYSNSVQLPKAGGTVYVRLMAGLSAGSYTGNLTLSSTNASDVAVALSGAVAQPQTGTVFKPGELFFTAYNASYSSVVDEYLFTTLVAIKPGTKFSLVNSTYEAGAPAGVRTDRWGGPSAVAAEAPGVANITYNGTKDIPAGSVIVLRTGRTPLYDNLFVIEPNATAPVNRKSDFAVDLGFDSSVPNISNSENDQVYLVQGTFTLDSNTATTGVARYAFSGTVLHGMTIGADWVPLSVANGSTSRTSRLPSALNCFNLVNKTAGGAAFYANTQIHTGGINTLLNSINTAGNWTQSTYTIDPAISTAAGKTFELTASNQPGTFLASADTDWFNCKNWENLRVPEASTDVYILKNVSANTNSSPFASDYSNTIELKDLNIQNTMTVNGALDIKINGNVNISNDGYFNAGASNIILKGNWNNTVGTNGFDAATSSITFAGSGVQTINENNHAIPGSFNNVVLANDFSTIKSNNLFAKGTLSIAANKTVTIGGNDFISVNGDVTNNGNLTVESDGNFAQSANSSYTGNSIKVNRNANLKRLDYNYWSSPVKNQNLKAFSPGTLNNRFYTYNEVDDMFTVVNPTQNTFAPGKGYAIRASNDYDANAQGFVGLFNGAPNNGQISVSLEKKGQGYNLVGNPYPSNLDFETLVSENSSAIARTAYFWTNVNANPAMQGSEYPKDGAVNNYAVYNATGGVAATNGTAKPTQYIKVGQGFIVQALSDGAQLTFKNSQRNITGESKFFNEAAKTAGDAKDRFWVQLSTPLNVVTTMLVGYVPGATDGIDRDYDAKLLIEGSDAVYTKLDGDKLAIQGRKAPLTKEDVVALGTNHYENGSYTLKVTEKEGVFANGQNIYLRDKAANKVVNLSEAPYTFTAAKGSTDNRFEIFYSDAAYLGAVDAAKNALQVYRDGNEFVVLNTEKITAVQVVDMAGRLVNTLQPNSTSVRIPAAGLSSGVYILKISTGAETAVRKVIK